MKTCLLTLLVAAAPLMAQSTVPQTLTKHWKTSAEFTLDVARAMPAESYNFRPVPEEMSFGQLMAHIANSNNNACANASGQPKVELPAKLADWAKEPQKVEVDREVALAFLKDTFDFCAKAVDATGADRLDKVVGPAARNLTGFEWLWSYFTHTAHHRAQAEVYLRVKGIKPPAYRF